MSATDVAELPAVSEEVRAVTGRAYLRAAVTLVEHAAVVLAGLPADELEPVPGMVGRIEAALAVVRAAARAGGEVPAPVEAEPSVNGGLW